LFRTGSWILTLTDSGARTGRERHPDPGRKTGHPAGAPNTATSKKPAVVYLARLHADGRAAHFDLAFADEPGFEPSESDRQVTQRVTEFGRLGLREGPVGIQPLGVEAATPFSWHWNQLPGSSVILNFYSEYGMLRESFAESGSRPTGDQSAGVPGACPPTETMGPLPFRRLAAATAVELLGQGHQPCLRQQCNAGVTSAAARPSRWFDRGTPAVERIACTAQSEGLMRIAPSTSAALGASPRSGPSIVRPVPARAIPPPSACSTTGGGAGSVVSVSQACIAGISGSSMHDRHSVRG